jgi:predicted nucleotidyltransferase
MPGPVNPNLAQLLGAASKLESLLDQIVFIGGCATGLLLTDAAAAPARATMDVDAIVEAASYEEFTVLEQRLRHLGFRQPSTEGSPICRWVQDDLILDLMPTDPSILGFGNRWYGPALENSQRVSIGDYRIRLITPPYFLGTKVEALHGRGNRDYRMSHDLEDIVTVIDGRPELVREISQSEPALRQYLSNEFRRLLANPAFREALPGHLLSDTASQQRISIVVERIQQIVSES